MNCMDIYLRMNIFLSNIKILLILQCPLPIWLLAIIQVKAEPNGSLLTTLVAITTLVAVANMVVVGVEIPPLLVPSQMVLVPHVKSTTNLVILLSTVITALIIPFKVLLHNLHKLITLLSILFLMKIGILILVQHTT